MTRARRLATLALCLIAAACRSEGKPQVTQAPASAAASAAALPDTGPLRRAERARYRVLLDSDVRAGARLALVVSGVLEVLELGEERKRLQLTEAKALHAGKAQDLPGLSEPFYATFVDRRVHALEFGKVEPGVRRVLAQLAAELQLEPGKGASTKRHERDLTGCYEAEYALLPAEPGAGGSAERWVEKRKLAYEALTSEPGMVPQITRSTRRFTLDPSGRPRSVTGLDELAVEDIEARSRATVSLELLGVDHVSIPAAPEGAAYQRYDWGSVGASTERELDLRAVGTASFEALAAALDAAEDAPNVVEARSKVESWLRLHPEDTGSALARARAAGTRTRWFQALGSAGTPAVQLEFAALIRSNEAADLRRAAVFHAALAREPSAELVEALFAILESSESAELRRPAVVSLGRLGGALQRLDAARARAAAGRLIAELERPRSRALRDSLVAALASYDGEQSLPVVERFLSHVDPALRAAALGAVVKLSGPAGEKHVIRALLKEPSVVVRRAALRASNAYSSPAFFEALEKVASSDPDADLRKTSASELDVRRKLPRRSAPLRTESACDFTGASRG